MSVSVLPAGAASSGGGGTAPRDASSCLDSEPPQNASLEPASLSDDSPAATETPKSDAPTSMVNDDQAAATAASCSFTFVSRDASTSGSGSRVATAAGLRYYSSSESECVTPAGVTFTGPYNNARKRSRQYHLNNKARGGKKRKITSAENISSSLAQSLEPQTVHGGGGGKTKALPRVPVTQQPQAPRNTTEFLIADREARESSDRDLADASTSNDPAHPRPRCSTYSAIGHSNANAIESFLNSSESSDEGGIEDEEDAEFDAVYDNAALERIEKMSRDQVNREMLSVNRSNSLLLDRIVYLKSENQRLKTLLQHNGIDFSKQYAANGDSNLPFSNISKQESSVASEKEEQNVIA